MELVIATRCAAPHMVSAAGWGGMGMGAWHLHLQHPDVLTCGSGDSQREKLKVPQCLLGSCPCPYSCHHGFSWDLPAFPSDITTLSPPHSFPYFWEEQTLSSTPLCQPRLEERNDQATHLDTGSINDLPTVRTPRLLLCPLLPLSTSCLSLELNVVSRINQSKFLHTSK